ARPAQPGSLTCRSPGGHRCGCMCSGRRSRSPAERPASRKAATAPRPRQPASTTRQVAYASNSLTLDTRDSPQRDVDPGAMLVRGDARRQQMARKAALGVLAPRAGGLAAIDTDDVARHPVEVRRRQRDQRLANILGPGQAAARIAREGGLAQLL